MTPDLVAERQRPISVAGWFVGLLTAYFATQIILRIGYASSLGLDEAEMLVITQAFAPGYGGSQPPLYTWLQLGAFQLFGLGIPALAIVKNLLLWSTFVFVFLSARLVLGDDFKAAVITPALFAIPQIGWESQRALTHTVLVAMVAAATLYVVLRLLRNGKWPEYFALGACLALGVLSKYNYALFAASLLFAAATIPSFRRRLFSPWMLLALALAFILTLPHLQWVWSHPAATLSRISKFEIADNVGLLQAWGRSLSAALQGVGGYAVLPAAIIAFVAFLPLPGSDRGASQKSSAGWAEGKQLILRTIWASLGLLLILVLATRTTEVRDRWLQPLLFIVPLGLFIWFENRLNPIRLKMLAAASAGLALAFMAGLVVTHFVPDLSSRPKRPLVPYAPLADEIRKSGFSQGYILAADPYIAGNLKLRFSDSTVAEPQYGLWQLPNATTPKSLLIAWTEPSAGPPQALKELWQGLCGDKAEIQRRSTPLRAIYEHSNRQSFTLHVIVLPMCVPFNSRIEGSAAGS